MGEEIKSFNADMERWSGVPALGEHTVWKHKPPSWYWKEKRKRCCLSKCTHCNDCTKKRHFASIILRFGWKRIPLNIEINTHNDIKSGGRATERPWSASCCAPQILNQQESSLLLWWMCVGTPRIERKPLICRQEETFQYGCTERQKKKKSRYANKPQSEICQALTASRQK